MGSRALVIAPNTIGEAVMVQPLLSLLRQRNARMRVDVLCGPAIAPVFRCMEEVAEVVEGPPPEGRALWAARWRIGRALRTQRYHHAYVLPETRISALVPWFAGIRERIGHRGQSRGLLLNRIHDSGRAKPPKPAEHFAALAFEPHAPHPGTFPIRGSCGGRSVSGPYAPDSTSVEKARRSCCARPPAPANRIAGRHGISRR